MSTTYKRATVGVFLCFGVLSSPTSFLRFLLSFPSWLTVVSTRSLPSSAQYNELTLPPVSLGRSDSN